MGSSVVGLGLGFGRDRGSGLRQSCANRLRNTAPRSKQPEKCCKGRSGMPNDGAALVIGMTSLQRGGARNNAAAA